MIESRVRKALQIEYEKRLMVYDPDGFASCYDYLSLLRSCGYSVYFYDDIERIRYLYETEIRNTKTSCAIIVTGGLYVPTDIRRSFHEVTLSVNAVFPLMKASVLKEHFIDIDLIDFSYDEFEQKCLPKDKTEQFLQDATYSERMIRSYIAAEDARIAEKIANRLVYSEWIEIAKENAKLEKYACLHHIKRNQSFLDDAFREFVFSDYGRLSGIVSTGAPTILPKVMDKIADGSRVCLLVVDGMSMFDFEILSEQMTDYDYSFGGSFALIPTITSISRQSLLAAKYPQQLEAPFSLAKEESSFYAAAQERGYSKQQLYYRRGYDADPEPLTRFAVVIINDIDDMVHGQRQGRVGMYQDVLLWAKERKLLDLIDRFLSRGFKVYLTADHGNTLCVGGGGSKRTGVETATKSRRMIILKDFAQASDALMKWTTVYPGYYCDKSYQYLICNGRSSFDSENVEVMTHGGISLEEVIVPFVEVRGKTNG